MSTSKIRRNIRQLDNDVQSIYEFLATIDATQKRQGNRLNEIDDRLTDMVGKLDRVIQVPTTIGVVHTHPVGSSRY